MWAACAVQVCGAWQVADPVQLLCSEKAASQASKKSISALVKDLKNNNTGANKQGVTPLMLAAECGQRLAACYLLAKGADATAKDKAGKTALDYAQSKELCTLLRQCMNLGVVMAQENRETELLTRGLSEHEKRCELMWRLLSKPGVTLAEVADLISLKAEWDYLNKDGQTLREAKMLSPEFFAYFVRKGFPVNAQDAKGKVTLSGDMQPATAKLALALGLELDDDDSESLMWAALYTDDVKAAKELLKKDKSMATMKSRSGSYEPLLRAQSAEMVKELVAAGADATRSLGAVIDEQTADEHEEDIVKALIEAGAQVEADMLLRLCKQGSADRGTAEALLKAGADIAHVDVETGNSPLHYAVLSRKATMAQWLMRNKAATEVVNKDGDTPLLLAVRNHATIPHEMIKLLIMMGADPKAKTADGKTAVQLAKSLGQENLVKLIKKTAAKSAK